MNERTTTQHVDDSGSTLGTIAFLLLGPIVWAVHFGALYGVQSVACAVASSGGAARPWIIAFILVATIIALAVLGASLARPRHFEALLHARTWPEHQLAFQRRAMRVLVILSVFAVAAPATALPIIDACAVAT